MKKKIKIFLGSALIILAFFGTGFTQAKWTSTFGGPLVDGTVSDSGKIIQTADGGYLLAGETESFGSGQVDLWVIKTTATGSVQWEKTYGGSQSEFFRAVQQTPDGGFILVGNSNSFGAFAPLIIRLDAAGNVIWQNTYADSVGSVEANAVDVTNDGGFILAGVSDIVNPFGDSILFKLDADGVVVWSKNYDDTPGDPNTDLLFSIEQTSDLGFIASGFMILGGTDRQALTIKFDSSGEIEWGKTFNSGGQEIFSTAFETSGGDFIATGSTDSFGAGSRDLLVVKLDASGNLIDQVTFGSSGDDRPLFSSPSGTGTIVGGFSTSSSFGGRDMWLARVDSSLNLDWEKTYGGTGFDLISGVISTSDGGYAASAVSDSITASKDLVALKFDSVGNTSTSCFLTGVIGAVSNPAGFADAPIGVIPATIVDVNESPASAVTDVSVAQINCAGAQGSEALSVSSTTIKEADNTAASTFARLAVFQVKLSGTSSEQVTASFTTVDGSAVAGSDYEETSGTVVFEPGQTVQTIEVPIIGDLASEAKERFSLKISNVTGATVSKAIGTATIIDDDK